MLANKSALVFKLQKFKCKSNCFDLIFVGAVRRTFLQDLGNQFL